MMLGIGYVVNLRDPARKTPFNWNMKYFLSPSFQVLTVSFWRLEHQCSCCLRISLCIKFFFLDAEMQGRYTKVSRTCILNFYISQQTSKTQSTYLERCKRPGTKQTQRRHVPGKAQREASKGASLEGIES
jgi:hypothetical protein